MKTEKWLYIKRTIEWHFKNYKAVLAAGAQQIQGLIDKGLIANYGGLNVSGGPSNSFEDKIIEYVDLTREYLWAKVVENVCTAFEFEVQRDVIRDKFENKMEYKELVIKYGNGHETVYKYRYDKIIFLAYEWAIKFRLLTAQKIDYI